MFLYVTNIKVERSQWSVYFLCFLCTMKSIALWVMFRLGFPADRMTEWQTDTYENITFLQLHWLTVVTYSKLYLRTAIPSLFYCSENTTIKRNSVCTASIVHLNVINIYSKLVIHSILFSNPNSCIYSWYNCCTIFRVVWLFFYLVQGINWISIKFRKVLENTFVSEDLVNN